MRDWVEKAFKTNILNNVINVVILGGIYYLLSGNGMTHDLVPTNIGFLFLYIPYYALYVPADAMKNARIAFIKKKLIVKEGETSSEHVPLKSIWRQITPESITLGTAAAAIGMLVCLVIGNSPYLIYIAIAYASTITCVLTHLLLKRHLARDLTAFIAEYAHVDRGTKSTEPFWKHFTIHYAIPWSIIIVYMNAFFGFKGNIEVAMLVENMGQVPASNLVLGVLIWTFAAIGWLGLVAMSQVVPDFHLGRILQERRALPRSSQKRAVLVVLLLLFAIPLAAAGITHVIVTASGITYIVVPAYVAISLVFFEASAIPGLYLGAIFGVALEMLSFHDTVKKS